VGSVEVWVYQMEVVIVEEEWAVLGVNLGRPIVNNGEFATRLFPNYFGQDLILNSCSFRSFEILRVFVFLMFFLKDKNMFYVFIQKFMFLQIRAKVSYNRATLR